MGDPLQVQVYDSSTGRHVMRLPYSSARWSDSIGEAGSMSVEVDATRTALELGLHERLRPWSVILAVTDGERILHAGPLTDISWDATSRRISLSAGGGMTLLSKRLVLNHRLASSWHDGVVKTGPDDDPGGYLLHLAGSYPDIVRGLVAETMAWSPLPIILPEPEGGTYYRDYYAWDMAYVADRIQDIIGLQHGPEVRFDPVLQADGSMVYRLRAATEIIDHHYRWSAPAPGQRVYLEGVDASGSAMCTQVYITGGKEDDETVMARRWLETKGPLLQYADTGHSTDSDLESLQEYAMADLSIGATPQETIKVKAGIDYDVHVGDWADMRVEDDWMGERTLRLKITDVDGSTDEDWLSLQCAERGQEDEDR